jgi:lysophospholipase L1-like esterase
MQQILVYGDSLGWGIIPGTRQRLAFDQRWPGVLEGELLRTGHRARIIEDCLNGRRTVWDDPFKPGRNGLCGLEQRMEVNSPLALVILALGTNDFQATHHNDCFLSAEGIVALIRAIRRAPIEPGMPVPPILVMAPPPARTAGGTAMPKFTGAIDRCVGVADAYQRVARELECAFLDAGRVVHTSAVDGVHLDADQHGVLGRELGRVVGGLLQQTTATATLR